MTQNILRNDAPKQTQISRIKAPESVQTIKISMNGKPLGEWAIFDVNDIVDTWNASPIPEYKEVTASADGSDVLLTAKTSGIPFAVTVTYGGDTVTNEKQFITIANAPTGGTFKLLYLAEETIAIAYNANAATILSALEGLSHFESGDLSVTTSGSNGFVVTFQGRYAGADAATLTVDYLLLRGGTADVTVTTIREFSAAQNKKVQVEIGGGPTGGYHTLNVNGTDVTPIAWDELLAGIQAEFNTDLGAGKATISNVSSANPDYDPVQDLFDSPTDTKSGYIDTGGAFTQASAAGIFRISGQSFLSLGESASSFIHFEGANLSIPSTATIVDAKLELVSAGSTGFSSAETDITAVDQAAPATITTAVDFNGRPRTTAKTLIGLPYQSAGEIYTMKGLDSIIQELVDTHGAISSLILLLEDKATDNVTSRDYDIDSVKLTVSYRSGNPGSALISYEVEFIGTLANQDVPVVASHALTPARANDTWEFDLIQTQTWWGETGIVQLLNGVTVVDTEGSTDTSAPENMVTFQEGVTAIMGRLVGDNYRITQAENQYTWTVELIDLEAGLNGSLDIYRMTWTPVDKTSGEPVPDPVAALSKIQSGGGAAGEVKRLEFDGTAVRGNYALSEGSNLTGSIAFDADAATVQAALEAEYGSGKVAVSGTVGESFDVTYDPSLLDIGEVFVINNLSAVNVEITGSASTGSSPITTTVTVAVTGNPTSGTHYIFLNGIAIGIAYNHTAATIRQNIENALSWEDSVDVVWSSSGGTITIVGAYGVESWVSVGSLVGTTPLAVMNLVSDYTASGNTIYEIEVPDEASGGYVDLINGNSNASSFWNNGAFDSIESAVSQIISGSTTSDFIVTLSGTANTRKVRFEFAGSIAGNDYTISMVSHLFGFTSSYQSISWAKTINGINGASILLTELQDGHPDLGEQQMLRVPSDVWYGSFTLTRGANTTGAMQFNDNDTTVQAALEGLASVGVGKVICVGSIAGMLCEFDTSMGNIATMTVVETDITNSSVVVSTSLQGGIALLELVQESRGPEHYDDPLNWTLGHVPNSYEDVVLQTGRNNLKYGLNQLQDFTVDTANNRVFLPEEIHFRKGQILGCTTTGTLPAGVSTATPYYVIEVNRDAGWIKVSATQDGSELDITDAGTGTHTIAAMVNGIVQYNRCTSQIGLPLLNGSGDGAYYEYRPTHLSIGLDPLGSKSVILGRGEGSGAGLYRFNFGKTAVEMEVLSTSGSAEIGVPSINIINENILSTLVNMGGDVGIAFFEQQQAIMNQIDYQGGQFRAGKLTYTKFRYRIAGFEIRDGSGGGIAFDG